MCIWHIYLTVLSSAAGISEEKSFNYSIIFSWLSASLIDTSALLYHRIRETFLPTSSSCQVRDEAVKYYRHPLMLSVSLVKNFRLFAL